jgi:MFS family permease
MLLGGAVTVVCILPVFLTGAMAVQLTADLAFGTAALGVAVALFRAAGAVASPHLGRLVDVLGAIRSIRAAALLAATASLGIAATTHRWASLVPWLMLGGCAQALGQPAANRLLANIVHPGRLGTAFGIKQSAPPAASMLAGVSVPLIALTWGWRWAFALAGVLAIAVAVAVGPHPPRDAVRSRSAAQRSRLERRGLVIALAVAFGLGTSTSSAVTTFYVDAAVRGGTDPRFAGTMLAVASVVAIAARVACGITCDRLRGGHLRLCAGLLALGSVGIGLLSLGAPNWMAAGSLIALAGTWGFNGVFWYALLRSFPRSPGRITGALAPGALLGSTAGPITFGVIAEQVSYAVAWGIMALVALVAAAAMVLGARSLPRPAPIVPEPAR